MECTLCRTKLTDLSSNNAWPFKDKCCNRCNLKYVVPIRHALMVHAAIQITETDKINIIPNANKLDVNALQELVGGYFEPIYLGNYVVLVDEEGRLKNKSLNRLWQRFSLSEQCVPLVGTVVLMYKEDLQ